MGISILTDLALNLLGTDLVNLRTFILSLFFVIAHFFNVRITGRRVTFSTQNGGPCRAHL